MDFEVVSFWHFNWIRNKIHHVKLCFAIENKLTIYQRKFLEAILICVFVFELMSLSVEYCTMLFIHNLGYFLRIPNTNPYVLIIKAKNAKIIRRYFIHGSMLRTYVFIFIWKAISLIHSFIVGNKMSWANVKLIVALPGILKELLKLKMTIVVLSVLINARSLFPEALRYCAVIAIREMLAWMLIIVYLFVS
mgnify:CR=1 FL=1